MKLNDFRLLVNDFLASFHFWHEIVDLSTIFRAASLLTPVPPQEVAASPELSPGEYMRTRAQAIEQRLKEISRLL